MTADIVKPHDPAELEVFATPLCGLGGLTYDRLFARLGGRARAGDSRHLIEPICCGPAR
jgi:hypothetical protein